MWRTGGSGGARLRLWRRRALLRARGIPPLESPRRSRVEPASQRDKLHLQLRFRSFFFRRAADTSCRTTATDMNWVGFPPHPILTLRDRHGRLIMSVQQAPRPRNDRRVLLRIKGVRAPIELCVAGRRLLRDGPEPRNLHPKRRLWVHRCEALRSFWVGTRQV